MATLISSRLMILLEFYTVPNLQSEHTDPTSVRKARHRGSTLRLPQADMLSPLSSRATHLNPQHRN
jgi:hypothetical protein